MLDDFFIRSIIAGIGIAIVAGPLGCFVVWRRMSYLGDTMAHSSLLGVAMGFLLGIDLMIGVFSIAAIVALLLYFLQRQKHISSDAILGTLSHASLALGVIVISLMSWVRIDLNSFLFGDILSVEPVDIYWIYTGMFCILFLLYKIWKPLLALTIDEDLAIAEGVAAVKIQLIFMLMVAFVIALAMKVVGILLVTSLLIIPATSARKFSKTPEQMALIAAVIGVLSVLLGLGASMEFDTPSGPSIVCSMVLFFFLSNVIPFLKHK